MKAARFFPGRAWLLSPAIPALIGWLAVVASLDIAGNYPRSVQGPGLTLDEPFNVDQGVTLVRVIGDYGWASLHPDSLREIFANPQIHLPDHPPLGRLLIGVFHEATVRLVPPVLGESKYVIAAARTAPATAWALLIYLIGSYTRKWYGPGAGLIAACSVLLMPRLFAHAHVASLESIMGLTYATAVLIVADRWRDQTHIRARTACLCGVFLGLALLTKIHGILLLPAVGVWALVGWRQRAIVPLLIWVATGVFVFFIGWPWLWTNTFDHFAEYFGSSVERARLYVWYFGERWADRDVPWHYPAVMFLTTIPVGLLLLGICGTWPGTRVTSGDRVFAPHQPAQLVLASLLVPLLVFSLPGVTVYDGTRLFLVVFPLWAVFAGRGAMVVHDWLRRKLSNRAANILLGMFVLGQGFGIVALHPCQLSYYNLLVGGPGGASRLGFEPTYWGDSITRSLIERVVELVPEGTAIDVSPVPHQFYLSELQSQSPLFVSHGIRLRPYDPQVYTPSEYLLIYRRLADLPEALREPPSNATLLAEVRRAGVQLAAFYKWEK